MLLVITSKFDATVDILAAELGGRFFRFNVDFAQEYSVIFDNQHWEIMNPDGLSITSESASACWWWKAQIGRDSTTLIDEEVRYFSRDLYAWFSSFSTIKGNAPYRELMFGKLVQMQSASKFLKVPVSRFSIQAEAPSSFVQDKKFVAKSLSSFVDEAGQGLFTTAVNVDQIDFQFPWFLQEQVNSDWDITIVVVGNQLFPFRKSRKNLLGLDWRRHQMQSPDKWEFFDLRSEDSIAIMNWCENASIEWGRLDFLLDTSDELVFLEWNPNGQWAFLDPENMTGLRSAVVEYLIS